MLDLSQNICHDSEIKINLDFSSYGKHSIAINFLEEYYQTKYCNVGYGISEIIMRIGQYLQEKKLSLTVADQSWIGGELLFQQFNLQKGNDVLYIVNPNGHTGERLSAEEIISLSNNYKLLIVDEAYGDFSNCSVINKKPENVIVLKTLSKSLPLPGVRFGWCFSNEEIDKFLTLKRPRNCIIGNISNKLEEIFDEIPKHLSRMIKTKNFLVDHYCGINTHGNYVLFDLDNEVTQKFKCNYSHFKIRMALLDMETFNQWMFTN
jgi:hypothetical protein